MFKDRSYIVYGVPINIMASALPISTSESIIIMGHPLYSKIIGLLNSSFGEF
jgi:hypothetical protein